MAQAMAVAVDERQTRSPLLQAQDALHAIDGSGEHDLSEDVLPADVPAVLLGLLDEQRQAQADRLVEGLRRRGVDATVCAFVRDDLLQASEVLADLDAWLQESMEALERPTPSVLVERAGDTGVLARIEHLQLTLTHLRRRLVQVAAGVRRQG